VQNTGSGGAGGRSVGAGGPVPRNGMNGIVIIRYPDTFGLAKTTTGSPTVNTTGGYRIYTFNSSGSITW
jgi:hypothetical protein